MPTSGPGSSRPRLGRGFTLIELLIVLVIIAVSVSVVTLALRDGNESRLEEEGARLSSLLEMARAEARVAGGPVRWMPSPLGGADGDQFLFVGLPARQQLPKRWLDPATRAQVVGAGSIVLGPDAILPPQRILLQLGDRRLELASDGLGPFVADSGAAAPSR